jgi:D-sedoheptulose 7-phosphate isomerase
LTAIGNDYSYEDVFAREVAAHGRPGDILVAISTSGNSKNVLQAMALARERGLKVIGLTGGAGGQMQRHCDWCLCVPSPLTPRVQEMHILIGHALCEMIEAAL